jgi:hypothetical protein
VTPAGHRTLRPIVHATAEQDELIERIAAAFAVAAKADEPSIEVFCRVAAGIDALRAQSMRGALRLRRRQTQSLEYGLEAARDRLRRLMPDAWNEAVLPNGFGGCLYLCRYWAAPPAVRLVREDYLPDADGAAFILSNALLAAAQLLATADRENHRRALGQPTFASLFRGDAAPAGSRAE